MNILMVGHSGAGKTSFMAGMYKYLGDCKDGYGIRSANSDQKQQLMRMSRNLDKGVYPSGTDIQQVYNFWLTCNGEDVSPFNWMDYRGGILLSDDPDEEDMNKFMGAIKNADALVVFLDGQKLSQKTDRWSLEYDILISCIENSLDVEHSAVFPICFVITKCDLVPNGATFSTFYGLHSFSTLFKQIDDSKTVGGMLLRCAINKDSYVYPFLVLSYCLYYGTPIYKSRLLEKRNEAIRRANYHRPESLIGKFFGAGEQILKEVADIVDLGWETEYEKTWAAEADYERESANIEFLETIADDLKDKLVEWVEKEFIIAF